MKLVVGLGNPGREYEKTRHNVGFYLLDSYLGNVKWKNKFESLIYEIDNDQAIFIKPITYMNLSGLAIKKVVDYYKINIEDILIIQDDADLLLGKYKLKKNSSSGGHNGIKSIINELNSDEFLRLKIGIGKSEIIPMDKYVLGKFSKEEFSKIDDNKDLYIEIINSFIKNGCDKTIMKYNKKLG